jgi:hypothetical protein
MALQLKRSIVYKVYFFWSVAWNAMAIRTRSTPWNSYIDLMISCHPSSLCTRNSDSSNHHPHYPDSCLSVHPLLNLNRCPLDRDFISIAQLDRKGYPLSINRIYGHWQINKESRFQPIWKHYKKTRWQILRTAIEEVWLKCVLNWEH